MDGAGIEIAGGAEPVIENNTITGNWGGADMQFPVHAQQHLSGVDLKKTLDASPSFGSGILIVNQSAPAITNNVISDSYGGGIAVIRGSAPRIEGNTVSRNHGGLLGGGIVVAMSASPQIVGNQITENRADWGGGIQIFAQASPLIEGNTIFSNSADAGGGGLYAWHNASPFVVDNVIADNQAQRGGAAICLDRTSSILDKEGTPLDLAHVQAHLEETEESLVWTGDWESDSGECYSGGTRMGSGQPGARVSVQFTGTGVVLIYFAHDDHGIAEVSIDGIPYSDIDMYAPEGRCRAETTIANDLLPSAHTLTISVSGRKNPSSSDVFVVVDALNIIPADPPQMGGNVISGSVHVQSPSPWTGEPGTRTTRLVPAEYPTIQEAIGSAEHGDMVVVAPGTYRENIVFRGKEIVLTSQNPEDRDVVGATIIEARESRPVVSFQDGETTKAVLRGFTLRNPMGSGAIRIEGASPVISKNIIGDSGGSGVFCGHGCSSLIRDNVIRSNTAEQGGGVSCILSSPTIEGNEIALNRATTGAGIHAWFSSPSILDNTISQNEAAGSSSTGGGIFLDHFSAAMVRDNLICLNRADTQGGGIYIDSSAPLIAGNFIQGNQADANAGVFLFLESSPELLNNTIADNVSQLGGAGGLGASLLCSPKITHNTIVSNSSSGQCAGIAADARSTVSLTNSILWNQGSELCVEEPSSRVIAIHSDIEGGHAGDGNISVDPLFVDPSNGDYRLRFGSPCIDAGLDTGVDSDFEGDLRPFDGDGDGIDEFDMGADEWTGIVRWVYLPLSCRAFDRRHVGGKGAVDR
jgi:parallel beta-helix repeat protein